jgi:hypothetical protein
MLSNYAGWLVVEADQDPDKANPLAYARMGHGNLVTFVRQAGLLWAPNPVTQRAALGLWFEPRGSARRMNRQERANAGWLRGLNDN